MNNDSVSPAPEAADERASTATHILMVEDDEHIADILENLLSGEGYRVTHATTGAEAKAKVDDDPPDLILLDLMLPDTDGLILCADLHAKVDAPIIICSATHQKRDAILGFKLGADDFVPKPFDVEELLARIEASLRRAAQTREAATAAGPSGMIQASGMTGGASAIGAPDAADTSREPVMLHPTLAEQAGRAPRDSRIDEVGSLVIDHARRQVTVGGHVINVTPTEYRILSALASRPDEVLTRDELATKVWGYQDAGIGRSIDVHMRRLRIKLGNAPVPPPTIVSVRGFGYKIVAEEWNQAAA